MRRRFFLLVAISNLLLFVVLAASVLPLAKSRVLEDQEGRLRAQILTIAAFLVDNSPKTEEIGTFLQTVDVNDGSRLAVFNQNGAVGRDKARFAGREGQRPDPVYLRRSMVERLYPWFFTEGNGDRIGTQAVSDGVDAWIIDGTITAGLLKSQERQWWLRVGSYFALVFLLSTFIAALISRRITKTLHDAVSAAEAMGRSDFDAAVPTKGAHEVVVLGQALKGLSQRVERLLESERERAAHLSHTLRTPLTAVSLEVDRLGRTTDIELTRLVAGIGDLERSLDDVIHKSRQTRAEGVETSCDAVEVLTEHLDYWAKLADLQDRPADVEISDGPMEIAMSAQNFGIVLDVLLSNIFRHTGSGVGYSVRLGLESSSMFLEIANDAGVGESAVGSSGLGLEIARVNIEAAGGEFISETSPTGGRRIRLKLRLIKPILAHGVM